MNNMIDYLNERRVWDFERSDGLDSVLVSDGSDQAFLTYLHRSDLICLARDLLDVALKMVDVPGRSEVLLAATEHCGSEKRAHHWYYTQRLSAFRGMTAHALVKAGRVKDVLDFIESCSAGFGG